MWNTHQLLINPVHSRNIVGPKRKWTLYQMSLFWIYLFPIPILKSSQKKNFNLLPMTIMIQKDKSGRRFSWPSEHHQQFFRKLKCCSSVDRDAKAFVVQIFLSMQKINEICVTGGRWNGQTRKSSQKDWGWENEPTRESKDKNINTVKIGVENVFCQAATRERLLI